MIVSQASGQLSLIAFSAQRRSNAVKRCGKVIATIAHSASSSYQPPFDLSRGWTLRFCSAERLKPPCPAAECAVTPSA